MMDLTCKVEGLMTWGATMDVCKDESIASMSQLQSCINNLLVMQKVFVEKLGVEM
jgi:hypothetical protein